MMETNKCASIDLLTLKWPPFLLSVQFDLIQLDLALISLYSNKLCEFQHPECILLRIRFNIIWNHTHIKHMNNRNIYRLFALLKVEWITAIKYKKTSRPMLAPLFAWADRYSSVCVLSLKIATLFDIITFIFSLLLCMVVSNRRKVLFPPESLYSTPIYFFLAAVVVAVYAHNRFQFHHWNLLLEYFFFLFSSSSFSLVLLCRPII